MKVFITATGNRVECVRKDSIQHIYQFNEDYAAIVILYNNKEQILYVKGNIDEVLRHVLNDSSADELICRTRNCMSDAELMKAKTD